MTSDDGEQVFLYVYDISGGMARQFSPMLLGRQVEAIYHTGVVVGGVEYFFGGGVQRCIAEQTPFGKPYKKLPLGTTGVPKDLRDEMLADLSQQFQPQHYHLINKNCNHFSNEFVSLLTGNGIPGEIVNQAVDIFSSPFGQMVMPMFQQMEQQLGGVTAQGFQQPQQQ